MINECIFYILINERLTVEPIALYELVYDGDF